MPDILRLLVAASAIATADPGRIDSLLLEADRYRGLVGEHSSRLEITVQDGDRTTSNLYALRVHPAPEGRSVLLRTLAPASEKGTVVLSRPDGMWILPASSSRPIPISAQQRLLGDASVGDVLNVELAGRYDGTESVSGGTRHLELAARSAGMLYERIAFDIDAASARPLSARFLSRDGRELKRLRHLGFVRSQGRELASELELVDAATPARRTLVRFSRFRPARFPSGTFEKEGMRSAGAGD
jgi:hypothetical protein